MKRLVYVVAVPACLLLAMLATVVHHDYDRGSFWMLAAIVILIMEGKE